MPPRLEAATLLHPPPSVLFELCDAREHDSPPLLRLASRRPLALLALVPRPLVLFTAGALSGAIAKSLTAPLDRVKILLQVKGGFQKGALAAAAARGSVVQSLIAIGREEGLRGYWKGNLPQILRVVPYSAAQLYSYEVFKHAFRDGEGRLTVPRRLAAGACAGMAATLLTYPLDTLRLRIAVDPACRTLAGAVAVLAREGSGAAFYRGLGASMMGRWIVRVGGVKQCPCVCNYQTKTLQIQPLPFFPLSAQALRHTWHWSCPATIFCHQRCPPSRGGSWRPSLPRFPATPWTPCDGISSCPQGSPSPGTSLQEES